MTPIRTRRALAKASITAATALASCACLAGCKGLATRGNGADAGVTAPAASSSSSTTGSVLSGALSLVSGGAFEGDITATMTREGKPPELFLYEVKGDKVRFVMTPSPAEATYVIVNYTTGESASVSDAKKTAMVMNMSKLWAGAPKKNVTPVPTGKDVVAGYACDVYRIDEPGGGKGEACLAKGIRFPLLDNDPWLTGLGDVFPMRSDRTDAAGKKTHMEVTKVDRKSLGDALFTVPPGYKTVSLDDLMKKTGH